MLAEVVKLLTASVLCLRSDYLHLSHFGLPGFRTLSIIWYSKEYNILKVGYAFNLR
jgi:hypothetical protein